MKIPLNSPTAQGRREKGDIMEKTKPPSVSEITTFLQYTMLKLKQSAHYNRKSEGFLGSNEGVSPV